MPPAGSYTCAVVDQIEAHVEKASLDVDHGRGELGAAVRFKVGCRVKVHVALKFHTLLIVEMQ